MSEITREDLDELVVDACKGCLDIYRCGKRISENRDVIKCHSYRKYEIPSNVELKK